MKLQIPFPFFLLIFLHLPFLIFSNNKQSNLNQNSNAALADTIPPKAYCLSGVITVPMPVAKCITIWAKDLDRGSFDNITSANKLKFYFNGDRLKVSLTICCDDFAAVSASDELIVDVQMWVEDEAGNTDYCKTVLIVQDNQNVCPDGDPFARISGTIKTQLGNEAFANIELIKNNSLYSASSGSTYIFDPLPGVYTICLNRNDDPLNGVTTADVVKIQRHILGTAKLNNPYLLIAADVNESNTITASDLSELRKLILGIYSRFNKVSSWIFIPKDTVLSNNNIPGVKYFSEYCRSFNVPPTSIINFIAVKMGDVTGDARGVYLNKNQTRNQNITLFYHSKEIDCNYSRTDFRLNNDFDLSGLQFTLIFNQNEYDFIQIENRDILINEDQYSLHDVDKGKIHFAWDKNPLEVANPNSGTLFSIIWKNKSRNSNDPTLNFDPFGVNPLIIDNELHEINLSLKNSDQNFSPIIKVYQDFKNQTIQIDGHNPNESNVTYSIIDITGRMILHKSVLLNEGKIYESIPMSILPSNALYLLSIQSGQYLKSWKIIRL